MMMKKIFTLVFSVGMISVVFGQPGSLDFSFDPGTGANGFINSIITQEDGKMVIIGAFSSFNGITSNRIARINVDGSLDASFDSGTEVGVDSTIFAAAIQSDGKIIIGGDFIEFNGNPMNRIARLNVDGSLDTSFDPGIGANNAVITTTIQSDGKIIIGGYFTEFNGTPINRIARLNTDGSLDESFDPGTGTNDVVRRTALQSDGKIIIGGFFTSFNGTPRNKIARLNVDGSLDTLFDTGTSINGDPRTIVIQSDGKIIIGGFGSYNGVLGGIVRLNIDGSLDTSFDPGTGANLLIYTAYIQSNGKIVVVGSFTEFNGVAKNYIVQLNADGSLDTSFDSGIGVNDIIHTTAVQSDGKIIIGGRFTEFNGIPRNHIARLNGDKGIYGQVYLDLNENCIRNVGETGIAGRNLLINPGNIVVQSQIDGSWYVDSLPAGEYTLTADTSGKWQITCPLIQEFTVIHPDSALAAPNFGFISTEPCPEPNISLQMPFMRPGFSNQKIFVRACNQNIGTDVLNDAYAEVQLDEQLTVESASLPYTDLGDNLFRFDLGDLNPGQCANFNISCSLSVTAVLGSTLCMEANLYPVDDCVLDTIPSSPTGEVSPCTLPWDQSSLNVEGWCANDSIYFTITNTGEFGGGDMECYSPVRIFVDGVLIQLDSILLQGGETFTYTFAGTAQTWIIQADQHPLHPGNSNPRAHVENCGTGTWTPDLVNNLPLDDADPTVDIYCGIVTGSYDPNDKRGFPSGISDDHFISKNQDLEYIIRFQNTGTDTAFTVVVRDTLDENFNIFTVTPGVSSHNYTFRMYGPRVLEWTFANILLPDSTTNEHLSNGFLTFTVKQNPDLAEGTVLSNDADIYFDFNEPIITNETEHKISYQINTLSTLEKLKNQKSALRLYPNPSNSTFTIDLNTFSKNVNYKIYSLSGTLLQEKENSYGQKISVDVKNLENGLYIIEIEYDNRIEVLNFVRN
jgi:uncharacterized delta-60 repeat protein/uncharacterized repeat protein (TIGR01451 family)